MPAVPNVTNGHAATLNEAKAKFRAEGEVFQTRNGPKDHPALRHELQGRAFIAKTLHRLGLNVEPLRPTPGRPAGQAADWMPPE